MSISWIRSGRMLLLLISYLVRERIFFCPHLSFVSDAQVEIRARGEAMKILRDDAGVMHVLHYQRSLPARSIQEVIEWLPM